MQVWIAFGVALLWGAAPDIGRLIYAVGRITISLVRPAASLVPEHVWDGVWIFLLVILPRVLPTMVLGLFLYYAMSFAFDVRMLIGLTDALRVIDKTLYQLHHGPAEVRL